MINSIFIVIGSVLDVKMEKYSAYERYHYAKTGR